MTTQNEQSKNKSQKIVNVSLLIFFSFIFLCLVTGLIAPLSRMLYGVFGLSVYGLVLAGILVCVLKLLGKEISIKTGYLINFVAMYVLIVLLVHTITSAIFINEGVSFGEYLSRCYRYLTNDYSSITFGGALSGIIVYPIYKTLTAWGAYIFLILALVVTIFVSTNFFLKFYSDSREDLFFIKKANVESTKKESKNIVRGLKLKNFEAKQNNQTQKPISPLPLQEKVISQNPVNTTYAEIKTKPESDHQKPKGEQSEPTYSNALDLLYGNKGISTESIETKYRQENQQPTKSAFDTAPTVLFGSSTQQNYNANNANKDSSKEEISKEMLTYSQSSPHTIRANPVQGKINTSPIINKEYLEKQKEANLKSENSDKNMTPFVSHSPVVSTFPQPKESSTENKSSQDDVFMVVDASQVNDGLTENKPVTPSIGANVSKDSKFEIKSTLSDFENYSDDEKITEKFDDNNYEVKNIEPDERTIVTIKEVVPDEETKEDNIINEDLILEDSSPEIIEETAYLDNNPQEENLVEQSQTTIQPIASQIRVKPGFTSKFDKEEKKEEEDELIIYPPYNAPDYNLLDPSPMVISVTREECERNRERIENTLEEFKIPAKVVNVVMGPTITRYELSIGPGVSVNRLQPLANDVAVRLAVEKVRWEVPIPGKELVGLEVPNKTASKVPIKEILASNEFQSAKGELSFAVGIDINGRRIVSNIAEMPHMLVAGGSGSGKSVALNSLIISLLYKYSPEQLRLVLVDPKLVEFVAYEDLPHLLINEVISEHDKILSMFRWLIDEMERRYKLLRGAGVVDVSNYNKVIDHRRVQRLPRIVVIVDELADLMTSNAKADLEQYIMKLSAKARAAGIHLVLATQRPSVNVINGTIKNNFGWRMALKVGSNTDSKTILDTGGAEKLLGKGDMLFKMDTSPDPIRLQGTYIDKREVDAVVDYIKNNNDSFYSKSAEKRILKASANPNDILGGGNSDTQYDPEFLNALQLFLDKNTASISLLQRVLKIGWNRAGRIMEDFESLGFVSPQDGQKPRQLLITKEKFEELFGGGES